MKKIFSILVLCLSLCVCFAPAAFANELNDIDSLLAPYVEVITELNNEIGSHWVIPDENKLMVYQSIKDKTPSEVKEMLKNRYYEANVQIETIPSERGTTINFSPITRSNRTTILQFADGANYDTKFKVESEVYSASGDRNTYVYEAINDIIVTPKNTTNYEYVTESFNSISTSSNGRILDIQTTGHLTYNDGWTDLTIRYEYAHFLCI